MENHPIPQDVTGFQFKLIGDMTVKQFAYLAAGCAIAYLSFISPAALIIKLPIAAISALLGVAFAFLPVEGRPLDTMLTNFIRALVSPNQYIYSKTGRVLDVALPHPQAPKAHAPGVDLSREQKLQSLLKTLPSHQAKSKLDEKEMVYFESLSSLFQGSGTQPTPQVQSYAAKAIPPEPKKVVEEKPEEKPVDEGQIKGALQKEAALIERELQELETVKKDEATKTSPAEQQAIHAKLEELEKQLQAALADKQSLEQKLLMAEKKLEQKPQGQVFAPSAMQQPIQKTATEHVRQIQKDEANKRGVPMTPEAPNLVTGVVKDSRGNIQPGVLVEIKDRDNNPVRAFKTNGVGQFASATPLPNGVFTIEFEDPKGKQKFDTVEITTTGQVVLPLEVVSTDEREELRKSLFK